MIVLAGCRQLLGLDDLPPPSHVDAGTDSPIAKIDAPHDAIIRRDAPPDAPAMVSGSLTVTPVIVSGNLNVDLTTLGTSDWAHWGNGSATGFDHKASGGSQIGNITVVGTGNLTQITSGTLTSTWTDGTPTASATNNNDGVAVGKPLGMHIAAAADLTSRTLHLYVGSINSTERLDVALSDGSAPPYSNTQTAGTTPVHVRYDIVYHTASAGQTVSITWTDTADAGAGNAGATWWFATLQ